ncbi:RagB/SusD family nutrient uptake outer membrane protein [Arcticibacterium luteifluviistationis]|uniref:RagB/SusD family nutrient uptake outer membrane protein n=1 Tax=Arcticibacterium luteifluviistationis TaxID=1784714 RepID=A0A2Z4GDN5_9BACT|nr:RagB/SusD family nutrient uptake outer membrane protein [Arcticibacterium luteifluviistationis]AWV99261.1 RagB/SusD family nutrient uptake outer membrane protein [Arcticibacterium luteifluviistationis]
MKLNNIIKPVKLLALAALLLPAQSCEDVLDEVVVSGIGNNYINTPKGFEDAVNAAYSTLRYWYGTQQGLTLTEYGTDIYATGADGGYKGFHFYDTQLNPSVNYLGNVWDELYRGINTCNAIVDRAPESTVAAATKTIRVAEAKFLRAHYYFILFQQYGGVDLRLSETLAPTKTTTRASDSEMYTAIISDLDAAIADLPATQSQYGRATKAAAEMALAKVYLAKAYSSSKSNDDFSKAATLSQSVINNYGFALLDDFASVFDENNQKNSEIVFSVQYTSDPLTNLTNNTGAVNGGNNLHLFFGMQYDVQSGMQRDIFYGRPFKRLRPTTYALETVFGERVNDSRYKKTFRDTWKSNKPGTYNSAFDDSKTTLKFASGDTTIFIPGYEMSKEERAKRPYQVLNPSQYSESLYPTLIKFFDTKRPDMTYESGSRDFFVFRLADAYLMLAEAQLGAGNIQDATEAINMVRKRAGWPGKKEAMVITSAEMNMTMLMEERARELAGEQTRWMDLKRWGNLVDRVKLYNPQAADNVAAIHLLRPIPQTQIDRSDVGVFKQNPGY